MVGCVQDDRRLHTGTLPTYSFLEPRWENYMVAHASTQHPDNSVYYGELLLKEVYEALRAGPHWNVSVTSAAFKRR